GVADVAQVCARLHGSDSQPHAFVGHVAQTARLDRRFADAEHAARVTVVAVLDDCDVDVDDVAGLEALGTRHTVAHHVVDGSADGFGIRDVTGWRVVQRGRRGVLLLEHVLVAERIELIGGNAGFHVRGDVVENLADQADSNAHTRHFFGRLEMDRHGIRVCGCQISSATYSMQRAYALNKWGRGARITRG